MHKIHLTDAVIEVTVDGNRVILDKVDVDVHLGRLVLEKEDIYLFAYDLSDIADVVCWTDEP